MAVLVQQDVLELDITVDDAQLVQVLQGQRDLAYVDAHVGLGEVLALEQVREELAAAHVLEYEMELGVRLKCIVERD